MTPPAALRPGTRWPAWIAVAALLALATAAAKWLDNEISLTSQAMLYLIAVVIVASVFERLPAVVCAVAAVTTFNFLFVPPRYTLAVEHHEHLIALAAMLLVALLVSYLATGLRRESEVARVSESRAAQLARLASDLVDAVGEEDAWRLGREALEAAFAGPVTLLATSAGGDLIDTQALPQPVVDGLRCCTREAATLGPGTARWPGLEAWYVPLGANGAVVGAARIEPADAANVVGREHAQALCALVAQGVVRLRLGASNLAAQTALERERLQATFLAAISHDLRTPLGAIVTAASSLRAQRDRLPPADQDRMLAGIVDEARQLTSITENTLQLVRLSSGGFDPRREWESLEEIVGAVVGRVRTRDPSLPVQLRVEPGLPLVRGDATLLAQALANLLDNARRHAGGPVEVVVASAPDGLRISVEDRGPGVAPADEARLFEPFFHGGRDAGPRGAGLGLALCKAIAESHGGRLEHRGREGGGSCFTLMLPSVAQPPSEPTRAAA